MVSREEREQSLRKDSPFSLAELDFPIQLKKFQMMERSKKLRKGDKISRCELFEVGIFSYESISVAGVFARASRNTFS